MKNENLVRIEHIKVKENDRWVYIETYKSGRIGINYMQGSDCYELFKERFCRVDDALTEFYMRLNVEYTTKHECMDLIDCVNSAIWLYQGCVL